MKLSKHMNTTEKVVFTALEHAAKQYTKECGRFIPFAEDMIHSALFGHEIDRYVVIKIETNKKFHRDLKQHSNSILDVSAIRKGCFMSSNNSKTV